MMRLFIFMYNVHDDDDDERSDLACVFPITAFSCDRVSPEDAFAQTPLFMVIVTVLCLMMLMMIIYRKMKMVMLEQTCSFLFVRYGHLI